MSEFLDVAKRILDSSRRPMRPREIVSEAVRIGLFSDKRAGKTPAQTLKSKLSVNIRRYGDQSEFVRTAPGQFYLRKFLKDERGAEYKARPITKPATKERVLVFDGGWFPIPGRFQGINKRWKSLFNRLLRSSVCEYLDRMTAENLDTHKQVLTYILVTRNGAVLAYKRGNYNRVEDFLRGCHCIGFGGHVTAADSDLFTQSGMGVFEGAVRELKEELTLPEKDVRRLEAGQGLSIVGVLNDDSSDVGQRHIAFVFQYEVSDDPAWDLPQRGEKAITQLRWLVPSHQPLPIWEFEYWSQLCLREYFPKLIHAAPAFSIRRRRPLQPPHLLCVQGAVGSGKSETTSILCDEFGYTEVNSGRVLAGVLGIPPVPRTPREVFQRKAWQFIQKTGGPSKLAKAILKEAAASGSNRVLIDGIRQRETLQKLRELSGDLKIGVLFVHTTPDVAYEFYKGREAGDLSVLDFLRIRNAPVEAEVQDMIGMSDAVVYNWTGRPEYRRTIRGLMRAILYRDTQ